MGLPSAIFKLSLWTAIISIMSVQLINFLPNSVTFTEFNVTGPRPLTGKLALNTLLNNTKRLFEHEIKGPEGFTVIDGELYTTLHGGYVVKVKDDKIVPVVKFGQPCKNWWEEDKCGRPLGLTSTADHHLIVADAYYGIWKHNVKTGRSTVLVDKDTPIEKKVPKIFNDVAVGKDGSIYWTHSSSDFDLLNGVYVMLADPSGRLMKYDPVTKKNTVILDKLYFANGVALSPNEDFVVVAETGSGTIRRVYLKGPKKFESDIFIDGLPGLPDGLKPVGEKGFFVTLNVARDTDNIVLTDVLPPYPKIRKMLANFLGLSDWILQEIHKIYPNSLIQRLIHIIGHFEMIIPLHPVRATVIQLNWNGEVVESYHGLDGSIKGLSNVIIHKDSLYLGSPYNHYLGRVELQNIRQNKH